MAISNKTRKNLWARSGNRCSICKTELFSLKSATDKINIGEECHIISCKPNGPRHQPDLNEYDNYDNLILLCRNHHKEIDELYETFSEEVLRFIKTKHENWVNSTLKKAVEENKKDEPRFLARITSGKDLLEILHESYGYRTDYEQVETEEEAKFIGGIVQSFVDYGDISGMVEAYDRVQMGYQLNQLLKEIEDKGYYLFGERRVEDVKFKKGETDNWPIATIVIKKKNSPEIMNFDLND
ncbi:HNH endonuclease [Muricauda sp. CAU 1633]|uniref:HNH endonuclease n=1 Tax=Allomuricauda sp. CAU 1633 TaxID=2816036 RepID=UPI001A9064A9|nr:HNH endonuclease signature motif containing protein [Muricauda sp. CAU 1633]MBO0320747.1 HNH endonuclease [Muricauda sp. CAU 1633]